MTNDERNPKPECLSPLSCAVAGLVHSGLVIPSDLVIRHSGLRITVHGEPPFASRMHWDHEPRMYNLFICKQGIVRFMESLLGLSVAFPVVRTAGFVLSSINLWRRVRRPGLRLP